MKKLSASALVFALLCFSRSVCFAQSPQTSQPSAADLTFFADFKKMLSEMPITGFRSKFETRMENLQPGETIANLIQYDEAYRSVSKKFISAADSLILVSEFVYKRGEQGFNVFVREQTPEGLKLILSRGFDMFGVLVPSFGFPNEEFPSAARELLCERFGLMCLSRAPQF